MTAPQNSYTAVWTILTPETMSQELDGLSISAPAKVLVRIAAHSLTSQKTLWHLSQNDNCDVRIAVGENPNTPLEILRKLAVDENPDVRYTLAENHNMYMEVLRILISDDNPYVASRAQKTVDRIRPAIKPPVLHCPISAQRVLAFVACA